VNRRLLTEQRVEAERILMATRAALVASPELLAEGDGPAIDTAIAALEAAKAGSQASAIKRAIEALDHASKAFAERRMNRALERGLAGRGVAEVEGKLSHDEHPHHHEGGR
jgi:molecular chaperone HscA